MSQRAARAGRALHAADEQRRERKLTLNQARDLFHRRETERLRPQQAQLRAEFYARQRGER